MNRRAIVAVLLVCVVIFLAAGYFAVGVIWNCDLLEMVSAEPKSVEPRNVENEDRRVIPPNQDFVTGSSDNPPLDLISPNTFATEGSIYMDVYPGATGGRISLETSHDPIIVRIRNADVAPRNLLLKVFYNYREANFRLQDMGDYDSQFLFELDADTSVNIPIRLSLDIESGDTNSRVTVALIFSPEHFIASNQEISEGLQLAPAIVINHVIDYGHENDMVLDGIQHEIVGEARLSTFSINTDSSPSGGTHYRFGNHPFPLTVERGEEVGLSFLLMRKCQEFLLWTRI